MVGVDSQDPVDGVLTGGDVDGAVLAEGEVVRGGEVVGLGVDEAEEEDGGGGGRRRHNGWVLVMARRE